jgi:hypothetical protein
LNRKERRAGGWDKLNPVKDYDRLVSEVSEDSSKLVMAVLRTLAGPEAPFDDRTLWNSTRDLINAGLMNVYIRFGKDGIEVRPEFIIPPQNDNRLPRGAA